MQAQEIICQPMAQTWHPSRMAIIPAERQSAQMQAHRPRPMNNLTLTLTLGHTCNVYSIPCVSADTPFEILEKFERRFCEPATSEMNRLYAEARKLVEGA